MSSTERTHVVSFTVPGEPLSKARARHVRRRNGVVTYTPRATVEAENAVARAFRAALPGWQPDGDNAYGLDVTFYVSNRRRRDVDNQLKLVADALNSVVWADDHQVVETTVRKFLVDVKDARTEVVITQVTPHPMGQRRRTCAKCEEQMLVPPTSKRRYCQHCRRG